MNRKTQSIMLGLFDYYVGVAFRREKGEYLTECPFRAGRGKRVGSAACQACGRHGKLVDNEEKNYVTCRQPRRAAKKYVDSLRKWGEKI